MTIAIFGACREGRDVLGALRAACIVNGDNDQPLCFLDNDSRLHGSDMDGLPIYSPTSIPSLPITKIVIGVIFNQQVTLQLQQLKRDDQQIVPFYSNDYYSDSSRNSGMATIGAYSYYRPSTILLNVDVGRYCHIGADCRVGLIGHEVTLPVTYPLRYHNIDNAATDVAKMNEASIERSKRTVIEDAVYIGEGATILGGVRVGRGSVIGSRALVTKDVPPYSIATGVPSSVRPRPISDHVRLSLEASRWWEFSQDEAINLVNDIGGK